MKLDIIKPNLTEVKIGEISVIFSYTTPVILINKQRGGSWQKRGGNLYLTTKINGKKPSQTTSRHISYFLNEEIVKDVFNIWEVREHVLLNLLWEIKVNFLDGDLPKGFTDEEAKIKADAEK